MTKSKFLQGRTEQCKSCIGRSPHEGGIQLQPGRIEEIVKYLCEGTQHVCHSNSNFACRWGRDLQLRVLCVMGVLTRPTDEALEQWMEEMRANGNEV